MSIKTRKVIRKVDQFYIPCPIKECGKEIRGGSASAVKYNLQVHLTRTHDRTHTKTTDKGGTHI